MLPNDLYKISSLKSKICSTKFISPYPARKQRGNKMMYM